MATRTQKIRECDRADCRNRKDVDTYCIIFKRSEGEALSIDEGELCPAHVKMVERFITNLFNNTKQYDEPEAPEEPLPTLPDDDDDLVKDPDGSVSIR